MCTVLNYRIYFKKQGRRKIRNFLRGKKWLWNVTRDERVSEIVREKVRKHVHTMWCAWDIVRIE